jgi:hypothetical protein
MGCPWRVGSENHLHGVRVVTKMPARKITPLIPPRVAEVDRCGTGLTEEHVLDL